MHVCLDVFFFFQAEDGIRDLTVTGVQTCALPISPEGEIPHGAHLSYSHLPCSSATQDARAKSSVNFKPRLATCGARQGRLQRSKSSSSNLLAELSQQTFQAVELCLQCRESFFGLRQVSLAAHLFQPQSGCRGRRGGKVAHRAF